MNTQIYFAPMEGITGYIYRNLYHEYFQNIDKFFTPFIVGNRKASMKARELRDVLPEHNQGMPIVPQILTNDANEFINTARRVELLGYQEINLNLGCPSGTVVSKGRGAGFLAYPDRLEQFLDEVFEALPDLKISIKTRLGKEFVSEFPDLLRIFNRYPLYELIIHPRTQKELYNGIPHQEEFFYAMKESTCPVCYNGNIFTVDDYEQLCERYPSLQRVMIGRGILANPFLVEQIHGRSGLTKDFVKEFYERLFDEYRKEMSGDKDVLFKMKELWNYQVWMFRDADKAVKAVRKAQSRTEFLVAIRHLIDECELVEQGGLFIRQ